ncbi:Imm52 family immunity protein [Stenotrophomonas forensis]|uniref:Immunity 52 family protein n=1 Tax=Stenotrophomonas forensis TaxID=2871169 RepID=A0ABY7Y2T1_9GAMM|nr:Imm52 family immunity protein [Stenotrophomonas sp. DFS-20110405]WDM64287.1 immunity 52 family protein [Stenotrophomonas sp. DFS-20110405]
MNSMYRCEIYCSIPDETLDAPTVYERLSEVLHALSEVSPALNGWVEHSRGNGPVPFSEKSRFIEMLAINARQDGDEYPTDPSAAGAGANLTTARTHKEWKAPGCATINYWPWFGQLTMEIDAPIKAFGESEAPIIVRKCVAAIAQAIEVEFISTDVVGPKPEGKEYETYYLNHRLFPHRRWLGWMGFVPELVPRRFIPEAAVIEVVKGRGTIIVAVDAPFDLHNPDHLKRVHQVELRMANAGLLEVIDPSLLE